MQRPLTGGIIVCLLVWMSPLVVVAMFVSKSRDVLEMEYLHRSPIADTDSSSDQQHEGHRKRVGFA